MKEPNPKIKYDESMEMNIGQHYNHHIEMIQNIIPKDNIQAGEYNLKGEFIYQICDTTRCIPYYDEINFKIAISEYDNFYCSVQKLEDNWSNLFNIYY